MKGIQLECIVNDDHEDLGDASKYGSNQLSKEFMPGDIVWIKINRNSWWPAQVVEDTSEGGCNNTNLEGEVCVRLYGSYECMHVDPMKYHTEFENILKKNNWDFKEILKKSLERDLSRTNNGDGIKRKISASEGEGSSQELQNEITGGRKSKQKLSTKQKADDPDSATGSLKNVKELLSARRVKVMQGLGLMAPCGSPFRRNGFHKIPMP